MNVFLGAYAPTATYDYNTDGRPIPYTQVDISALIDANNLQGLMAAINDLTAYEASCRKYYDDRVNRTSGGKRDRLRAERQDLTDEALAGIRLATVGVNTVQARITAAEKAKLPSYSDTNSQNALWSVSAPGLTNTPGPLSPNSNTPVTAPSPVSSMLLPLGAAAVAAFLLLKGH